MSDGARERLLRKKKTEATLELAFDNELDEVKAAIEDEELPLPVDPPPRSANAPADLPKEDTFLGEASCGGALDVMRYLLEKGADPNKEGKLNRTPLHRALNNDQAEAVKILLEAGADPRLLLPQEKTIDPDTGATVKNLRDWEPEETNGLQCGPEIKAVLKAWPIAKTIQLQRARQSGQSAAQATQQKEQEAKVADITKDVASLEAQLKEAEEAHAESIRVREQRIREYDLMKCENRGTADQETMLHNLIKEAEADETAKRLKKEELRMHVRKARVQLREQEAGMSGGLKYDVDATLTSLEDLLGEAKKVVLVVDETKGDVTKFLTYRPVLLIDVGHSQHMHNVDLRLSILSSLRYGRTLCVLLRDWDSSESLERLNKSLNSINDLLPEKQRFKKPLLELIESGEIKQSSCYENLITEELEKERNEFFRNRFSEDNVEKFHFALITEMPFPPQELLSRFYSVRITPA